MEQCQVLYRDLLRQLHFYERKSFSASTIEQCFETCYRFCRWLEDIRPGLVTSSEQERLRFYKNVQPRFAAQLVYYRLLYYSELFKPEKREEAFRFWSEELVWIQKFIQKYDDFHRNYRQKSSSQDDWYFTEEMQGQMDSYDFPGKMVLGSWLAGQLRALQRYDQYAQQQLVLLEASSSGQ